MLERVFFDVEIIATGCIVAPKGFKAGATYCGIKTIKDSLDLGIIFSEHPSTGAAVFTTNQIYAAPVKLSRKVAQKGYIRACVINSGNGNHRLPNIRNKGREEMARIAARCL